MRVSFDIDDTLVLRGDSSSSERPLFPKFVHRRFFEPLRTGTRALFRELRNRGCSVWIYTSSERSPSHIHLWMALHGIRIDGVINGRRHCEMVVGSALPKVPSKYPPAFGIDLHIDDSEGVGLEGSEHHFSVLVIKPDDERWTEKVLSAVSGNLRQPVDVPEISHGD